MSQVFYDIDASPLAQADPAVLHPGMPPLDPAIPRYPPFKRRLSDPVFYAAPILMWLALSLRHGRAMLPSAANAKMEVGGLWGESKLQCLSLFGEHARGWLAPFVSVMRGQEDEMAQDLARLRRRIAEAKLSYPLVAKPDIGYQGWGVRKLADDAALADYLCAFPTNARLIVQAFVPHGGEAGIFYIRRPGEETGRIASLSLTYAPHVIGDGISTLDQLIADDRVLRKITELRARRSREELAEVPAAGEAVILVNSRSARLGAVYRDGRQLVTEALSRRIDAIARDIDGFHFGRFDIRFASTDRLCQGEDFNILELNGAGAEMLHIWDGRNRISEAYRTLWHQYRTAFSIGAQNAHAGSRPAGLLAMFERQRRQERLRALYPPSG